MPKISITAGDPIPKSLGRCADELADVRALAVAMGKEVAAVKKRESELRDHLIESLSAGDDSGAAGAKYRAQIKSDTKATVTDWEPLYDYVVENDRFDLLSRSVSQKAIAEIWEAGNKIPGVDKINVKSVSITKI